MFDDGGMAAHCHHSSWEPVPWYPLVRIQYSKSASGYQSKTDLIYRLTENQNHVFYETTGERTQWKGKVQPAAHLNAEFCASACSWLRPRTAHARIVDAQVIVIVCAFAWEEGSWTCSFASCQRGFEFRVHTVRLGEAR